MGFLAALLVIGIIYFLFFKKGSDGKTFLKNRKEIHKTVEREGGMYELYQEFVDYFKDQGFQIREINNDSLYLHYGTSSGKVGIQIIQVSINKAEILIGVETPEGLTRDYTIQANTQDDFKSTIERLLSGLNEGAEFEIDLPTGPIQKEKEFSHNENKLKSTATTSVNNNIEGTSVPNKSNNNDVGERLSSLALKYRNETDDFESYLNSILQRLDKVKTIPNFDPNELVFLELISDRQNSEKIELKFIQEDPKRGRSKVAYLSATIEDALLYLPSITKQLLDYDSSEKEKIFIGQPFPTFNKKGKEQFLFIERTETLDASKYQHENIKKTASIDEKDNYSTKDGALFFPNDEIVKEPPSDFYIEPNGVTQDPLDTVHYYDGSTWMGNKKM